MGAVLCVRHWDRFQHYKDRDPPWVKLYRDLLTAESWVLGTDVSRVVQVASILLAARYSNQIPYRWDLIRKVASLDCSEAEFAAAVQHLVNTEFLEIQGCTEQSELPLQPASTMLAKCSTETETEAEGEQRQKKRMGGTSPAPDEFEERFQEFRSLYPKRSGDHRWQTARNHIRARLREGHTWDDILDGTRRYAAFVRAKGDEGTPHTKQAASFVGTDRCFLEPWTPPPTKAETRLAGNVAAVEEARQRIFAGGSR